MAKRIDKAAHAANVLVSAGALALADGIVPGAGAAISGYLSLTEITKQQSPELQALGQRQAEQLKTIIGDAGADDPKYHLPDMILLANFCADDLIAQKLDAKDATNLMLRRVCEAAPRSDYVTDAYKSCFRRHVTPMMDQIVKNAEFVQSLQPQFMQAVLALATGQQETLDQVLAILKDHVEALRGENADLQVHARTLVARDTFIKGIARNYLSDPTNDAEAALHGIEAALMTAARQAQRSTLPTNSDAAVAHVLSQVNALHGDGKFGEARQTILSAKEAWHQEEQRRQQEYDRIIDAEIANARFRNDPQMAVSAEIDRLRLSGPDFLGALVPRAQEMANEYSRVGVIFDGYVARGLFQTALEIAEAEDEPDVILGNLASLTGVMGERSATNDLLLEAIDLFGEHERNVPRSLMPLDWALGKNNLSVALTALGNRENNNERLEQSVEACHQALEERTRQLVPLDWAMTQNNIGNALTSLARWSKDSLHLEMAVDAFHQALTERTREKVPMFWAMTQNNLGNALTSLFRRNGNRAVLEQAVKAYRQTLLEWTLDAAPMDWALTQNNLGSALSSLGELDGSSDHLREAIEACNLSLTIRTRENDPLGWAATQSNLGSAYSILGAQDRDSSHLELAIKAYELSLFEITPQRRAKDWAGIQNNLGNVFASLFDLTAVASHLDRAQEHFENALAANKAMKLPQLIEMVEGNLALLQSRRDTLN